MGNQFYYTDAANEVKGPCTNLRLMALQKSGELNDASLVCAEGTDEWVELRTVFPANRIFKSAAPAESAETPPDAARTSANDTPKASGPRPATRTQAALIILILLAGIGFPYLGTLRPVPKWEYQKVVFRGDDNDRIGAGALKYSSIKVDQALLNQLGNEGWELTSSYLEMETAFPDLGLEDKDPDLQPNIRPQAVVFVFKRPL